MTKSLSTKVLNIILTIGIIATILIFIGSPFIFGALFKTTGNVDLISTAAFYSVILGFMLCALPYIIALFSLKNLIKLISKNQSFSLKSIKILNIISICSFSELILFVLCSNIIKRIFIEHFEYILLTPVTIVIAFICLTLGFLFLILAKLFKNALELKEENDMTI
ncbi:MAG: DUF2975 domain-containing protein [Sarcina sp.]